MAKQKPNKSVPKKTVKKTPKKTPKATVLGRKKPRPSPKGPGSIPGVRIEASTLGVMTNMAGVDAPGSAEPGACQDALPTTWPADGVMVRTVAVDPVVGKVALTKPGGGCEVICLDDVSGSPDAPVGVERELIPTDEGWTLTDLHKSRIPAWDEKWNKIVCDLTPMSEAEKVLVRESIENMYTLDKLPKPKIVYVKSPLATALIACSGAVFWDQIRVDKTHTFEQAVEQAKRNYTSPEVVQKRDQICSGSPAARALYDHTLQSVLEITFYRDRREPRAMAPLDIPYLDEVFDVLMAATVAIHGDTEDNRNKVAQAYLHRNGGNQWCNWVAYLDFIEEVINWKHPEGIGWEDYYNAGIHSGPRYMHPDFNVVSDRPYTEHVTIINGAYQPSCDNGPALAWADGFALWYLDGQALDSQIIMRPETQTKEDMLNERNGDVQTIRITRYGWENFLKLIDAKMIGVAHNDIDGTDEAIYVSPVGGNRFLVPCPTGRKFALGVGPEVKNCEEARDYLIPFPRRRGNMKINLIGRT